MISKNLDKITAITVELHKDTSHKEKLGTGVIYSDKRMLDKIYILTAKHCLSWMIGDERISLRMFNPISARYEYITPSNQKILLHQYDDAGIIICDKRELDTINSNIPLIYILDRFSDFENAVTKGFPIANLDQTSERGESTLATLNLKYLQETPVEQTLQLSTIDDYDDNSIRGISGAGIFLEACEELYIAGIFTRFSGDERGKVVYAQYLSSFNELLQSEYKKKMPVSFLGRHGLAHRTFENNVELSVTNLGPRYCQKVNVNVGIARYFKCIAKTTEFYDELTKTIDTWLTEKSYRVRKDSNKIGILEVKLEILRGEFAEVLCSLNRSVNSIIDFSGKISELKEFQEEVETEIQNISKERLLSNIDRGDEESRLYEISNEISDFIYSYNNIRIDLANNPYLIIKGEAGCGKSHLMGDIANKRISEGLPTLLFLGTDFVNNTYEYIITNKLGFNGTFSELLSSLNLIGSQISSRVLLMIDALNEGAFATSWKNNLSGLIKQLKSYPGIGLVVSVRDTYFDDVIPDNIVKDLNVTIVTHNGFKGLEYEAVRQFCFAYELNLPNVPILTPEFCNPLFLKIVCDTLVGTSQKDFPKGFNGIYAIFEEYFKILDRQFASKKQVYKYRDVVSSSIEVLALPIFQSNNHILKIQEADKILQQVFPECSSLLVDLIENNVLLRVKSPYNNRDYCIVICYQRISDFIIAKEIIKKYQDWDSFVSNISMDKNLNDIFIKYNWHNQGIIEALSIYIPELFKHELLEAIEHIPLREKDSYCLDTISSAVLNGLPWRSIKSINKDYIINYLKSGKHTIELEDWYNKIIELSIVHDHPFNADYFHNILIKKTMRERDAHLQYFFNGSAGYDNDNCANPIRRLIDWAWMENISEKTDYTSARLAAKILCWLLSSTYIKHRDEATKALVNLLTCQVDALIDTIQSFNNVDDMYIKERIYAVAYGVALRTPVKEELIKLASYVYETIFKDGLPPKNVLLRDYARNIIEYAYYKENSLSFNMEMVRPPYKSVLPEWPTDDDVDKLHIDYNSPDWEHKEAIAQNYIWESIKGGLADFWNKIALSVLEDFFPISIEEERKYIIAEKSFKGYLRKTVNYYTEIKARERLGDKMKPEIGLSAFYTALEFILSPEQLNTVNQTMIPYKVKELNSKRNYYNRFPTEGIRNWLIKRSYDLGFDIKLHGRYDEFARGWTFRHSDDRIDRIGKKYQWIAFYEIIGILSDNYKFENKYSYFNENKYEYFNGPWETYLRNINPSIITRKVATDENIDSNSEKWWLTGVDYNNWQHINNDEDWASLLKDLPDPINMIQTYDKESEAWFALGNHRSWIEPKTIGEEEFSHKTIKHSISLSIDAILVRRKDLTDTIRDLSNKNLWEEIDLPTDGYNDLFNREKYWSPAYKDIYRNRSKWLNDIKGLSKPCMFSWESACGNISNDISGTIKTYAIPCMEIFNGLKMDYALSDGAFVDKTGRLVAISFDEEQVFVRKATLIEFLKKRGLEIVWIVRGEKRAYMIGGIGCISEYNPCGVYYIDRDNNPIGELKTYKRV